MDGLPYRVSGSSSLYRSSNPLSEVQACCLVTDACGNLSLPAPGLCLQTLVKGQIAVPFGHRNARLSNRHFRVGFNQLENLEQSDPDAARAFWLHVPFGLVRPRMGLALASGELDTLKRIRMPLSGELGKSLQRMARMAATGRITAIRDGDWVIDIVKSLDAAVAQVIRLLDRLPGRSLFKRADLFMRLEAAHDYIEDHFAQDPTTPFLAEISHISRAHFIRLFSSFYGISPKQMTLELKLDLARSLLRESDDSVAEVAATAGFGNRCAFQRLFKERIGVTPLQFRRSSRDLGLIRPAATDGLRLGLSDLQPAWMERSLAAEPDTWN